MRGCAAELLCYHKRTCCPCLVMSAVPSLGVEFWGNPWGIAQVLERILAVDFHFPSSIPVTAECKDLLTKILVADSAKRYTIADIQRHPWCRPQLAQTPLRSSFSKAPLLCSQSAFGKWLQSSPAAGKASSKRAISVTRCALLGFSLLVVCQSC